MDRVAFGAYIKSVIRDLAPHGPELEAKLVELLGPDWRNATDEQIDAVLVEIEAIMVRPREVGEEEGT